METTYLGVVQTDDLSCAKDVEQAKLAFFINLTLYITNLVLLIKMICYTFLNNMQCRFRMLKPGIQNSKKCLKNFSVPYHKAIKRICGRNSYESNHECLE